jgi:sarcosine oxidase subunit beta
MGDRAKHVIIGGGIAGCSLAYFLLKKGIKDVILLEQEFLASKETGLCPGGIRQQHTNEICARLAKKSVDDFFTRINEELKPEYPFSFLQTGYMFLAHSQKTLQTFEDNVQLQNKCGIPSEIIKPEEISKIVPGINRDGLLGAAFCQADGFLEDSHRVTQLLGKRVRDLGGKVLFEEATDIMTKRGRITGVKTNQRSIETESVINAAGCNAPIISNWIGVTLPLEIQKRRLLYTTRMEERFLDPLVVAFDKGWAGKQLSEGNVYLGYLREAEETISDHQFKEKCVEIAIQMMPKTMARLQFQRIQEGRYDMTPDGQPIVGGIDEVKGYTLMNGFSGHGFMLAPALGMVVSDYLTGKKPAIDIEGLSLKRFHNPEIEVDKLVI